MTTPQEIARLFVGVNAVGIWDELFFICTVLRAAAACTSRSGTANVLQAIVFVSFLWELGYREWGPLLTIPFALVQGWIFAQDASRSRYVVTVHLLFDLVVFMVLVHAPPPGAVRRLRHGAALTPLGPSAPARGGPRQPRSSASRSSSVSRRTSTRAAPSATATTGGRGTWL